MFDTVADSINPFNKDAKYEAQLGIWQESMERQNLAYERIEGLIQMRKYSRADLLDEERNLVDKLGPRAKSIKAEVKGIEKYIQFEKRGLKRRTAAREATLNESKLTCLFTPTILLNHER